MSVNDQWSLLRQGQTEEGLTLMQKSLNEAPTPRTLVTLGLGYLWTEHYEAAWKLFQDWMDKYRVTMEIYLVFIGVSRWCLGDFLAASGSWKLGLKAQYRDMAGGIESPLLLWVASVLRPDDTLRREAVRILTEKVKNPKIRHWPGAMAQFVLNEIDGKTLEERSIERLSQKTPPSERWQVEFYKRVVEMERRELSAESFRISAQSLVDTSTPEWSKEETFLQLVRNPEFHILRHEVSAEKDVLGDAASRRI